MKVIAFSLWGDDRRYLDGALVNAQLAQLYYPGWSLWMFCSFSTPIEFRSALSSAGFYIIVRVNRARSHEGLFWRFWPASHPSVEAFISRDCDSRLNPREAAAVQEWLKSGKRLHTMRDHYEHIVPILGGMWGSRHWPEMGELINAWDKKGSMGQDQDFLKEIIWPRVRDNDSIAHDRYTSDTVVQTPNGPFTYRPIEFFGKHDLRPFPPHEPLDPKIHGEHVGARVWSTPSA